MSSREVLGSDSIMEVVSTETKVDTKFVPFGNNSVQKITTTTTKKIFSDGSSTTTIEKKTLTETIMSTSSQSNTIITSTNTSEHPIVSKIGEYRLRAESQKSLSSTSDSHSESSDDDDDGEFSAFQREALKAHNTYREKHGVPPLKLKKTMCEGSQNWVNTLASKGKLEHNKNSTYGENIYMTSGSIQNGKEPVDNWYKEGEKYKFEETSYHQTGTGHFSQVVWKDSSELGIAKCAGSNGTYVVANYNPPGNVQSQYKENVLPSQK